MACKKFVWRQDWTVRKKYSWRHSWPGRFIENARALGRDLIVGISRYREALEHREGVGGERKNENLKKKKIENFFFSVSADVHLHLGRIITNDHCLPIVKKCEKKLFF